VLNGWDTGVTLKQRTKDKDGCHGVCNFSFISCISLRPYAKKQKYYQTCTLAIDH
jgi:hypothetical protein